MLDTFESLETLVPDVMRAATTFDKTIPSSMALADLVRTAAEFCRRAFVLTDEMAVPLQDCVTDYRVPCAGDLRVYLLSEVRQGARLLHGLASGYARQGCNPHTWEHGHLAGYYFEPTSQTIHLAQKSTCGVAGDLWMRAVLTTDGISDSGPTVLLDNGEWRDALISGAIATMAEIHAPARAAYWRAKFEAAVNRAVVMRVSNYSSAGGHRMSMTARRFIRR
jgi:hypothetical protein